MVNKNELFNLLYYVGFCFIVILIARRMVHEKLKDVVPGVTKIKMSDIFNHKGQNIFIILFLGMFFLSYSYDWLNSKKMACKNEALYKEQSSEQIKKVIEAYKNGKDYTLIASNVLISVDPFVAHFIKVLVGEYKRLDLVKKDVKILLDNANDDSKSNFVIMQEKCEQEKRQAIKCIKEANLGNENTKRMSGDFIRGYDELIKKIDLFMAIQE